MSSVLSSVGSHLIKHQRLYINLLRRPCHTIRALTIDDDSYNSPYLSVNLSCPKHLSDAFSESLLCFGAGSTTIDHQESHQHHQIWIRSTFNVGQDVKCCISRAADSVGLKEIPTYKVEMHHHTDWIKKSQESFHPVEITEGLWIVPEWRNPPDVEATNIFLNPGLAFGTGDHPTTKLCLLFLHRLIKGGEHFLNYGTGSGVLAIAALKTLVEASTVFFLVGADSVQMGANLSVGFDIEPQAISSARHNAALNNIGPDKLLLSLVNEPQLEGGAFLYNSDIISQKHKFDVVVANILLHLVLDLADRIVSYAKPGAAIGISGILSDQVQTVIEHYSQYMEDINVSMLDDWACISGTTKILSNSSLMLVRP